LKPKQWEQEKRTLGTTAGGSTYTLTLPKAWIKQLALEKGHPITLTRVGGGIYLELDKVEDEASKSTQLDIDQALKREGLVRTLISRYIAGFNVLEISGEISAEQRVDIRHTVQRLIGAEILQETGEFTLIHILRDPQVLSVRQLLDYIKDNVTSMLQDAPVALLENDREKAIGVVQRDDRVDRFFLLLSRRLYAALRDPLAEVKHRVSRVDFFNVHNAARQLERIADHAVKIAQTAQTLIEADQPFPQDLKALLEQAHERVQTLLKQVMSAFEGLDVEQAHSALETLNDVTRLVNSFDRRLLELENTFLAHHLSTVTDSIGRVRDYAGNIAELALNASALGAR